MKVKYAIKSLLIIYLVILSSASNLTLAVSLEAEIKIGTQEHRKIIAQYGVYRDKDLQTYIDLVGQRVAEQSSRPELTYHFTILNDDAINAFALPGGFVYLTRGMLTHMNSESELAAVLGHEIAHITEKHAFKSQNRGKLLNAASTLAAIVTQTPGVRELGNLYGDVLLKGYSREFELEADRVGAQYMAKAGYSPEAMLKTIEILKNKDRIEIEQARLEKRVPKVYHGFLSTHPDQDSRYKQAVRESESLLVDNKEFIHVDEFMEKLNGLAYGSSRQAGVVRKNIFFYPKLSIKMNFPQGWKVKTMKRSVLITSLTDDAMLAINTARRVKDLTPRQYLEQKLGLDLREGKATKIADLTSFIGVANRADSPFGPRPLRIAALEDPKRHLLYLLSGAGKHDLHRIANDRDFITIIFSFDRMDKDDHRIAKAPRLQILRAEESTTMETLAANSPITNYALQKLRVMNGLYPGGQPKPGQLIKIVD